MLFARILNTQLLKARFNAAKYLVTVWKNNGLASDDKQSILMGAHRYFVNRRTV